MAKVSFANDAVHGGQAQKGRGSPMIVRKGREALLNVNSGLGASAKRAVGCRVDAKVGEAPCLSRDVRSLLACSSPLQAIKCTSSTFQISMMSFHLFKAMYCYCIGLKFDKTKNDNSW